MDRCLWGASVEGESRLSASASPAGKELYEFGPFRIDPEKEVLLREGDPVPLTPKTFQILLVLVRHSQQVVTKDDLMTTVWPDTFVEEANLSRNIFMLRKALGETPQDHRYIVTVPGRGYRLAESVRVVPGHELSVVAASHSRVQVEVSESKPWHWVTLAVLAVIAGIAGGYLWFHRNPVLSEKDTVVLADFANTTGDPVFDETLRQGIAIQLRQSPYLRLISDERIGRTLRLMGKLPDSTLTPDTAREVCERTGSAAVLEGSIAPLGSEFVLTLSARNCRNSDVLATERVEAKRKEDVLQALDVIASRFRTKVGESLASVEKYDQPLADATTPSLEALKAYSTGWRVLYASGSTSAIPFFQKAVEIDPRFASAYAALGRMYGDLGEFDLSAANTAKAYELRERTTDREKSFITASYEMQVIGNLEKAEHTCNAWKLAYPRDTIPRTFLSGIVYPVLGNFDLAAQQGSQAIALDADFGPAYVVTAYAYEQLAQFDQVEDIIRRAAERGIQWPDFTLLRYDLAFLKNDPQAMAKVLADASKEPDTQAWLADHQAFVAAYHGQLREARRLVTNAAAVMLQAGDRERAAQYQVGEAVWEAWYGDFADAVRSANAALKLSHARDVEYGAALAFAMAKDTAHAQSLTNDLERRFPEDTSVKFSYLPTVRAILELNAGDAAKALELLQAAGPYDLGTPRSAMHAFFGAMYPSYVRGEAYLALHQYAAAASEFQRIVDHPGIVVSDPVGALARLQLAHSRALAGDTAPAKASYDNILSLWSTADPDLSLPRAARTEMKELRQ